MRIYGVVIKCFRVLARNIYVLRATVKPFIKNTIPVCKNIKYILITDGNGKY